jgi:folate-binding protein YgfZ
MPSTGILNEAIRLGATLGTHGGLELPSSYSTPEAELRALREHWAVYDQSHHGRLRVRGEDRVQFLHNLTTNDVKALRPGQGHSTVIPNVKGRILDWGHVYAEADALLLITQPAARDAVLKHFDFYHFMEDVEVDDLTEQSALLAVSGPAAAASLERLLGTSAAGLAANAHLETELAGVRLRLLRYDRFGHRGFRLWCEARDAAAVFRALLAEGATPAGEAALERLRVALGEPAHGAELTDERNPLEAGLYGSLSFSKGCYLGQEVIARLDTYKKVARFLVHLAMGPEAEPELTGKPKLFLEGQEVGWLRSWAPAPDAPGYLALGYTSRRCHDVQLSVNGRVPARVLATLTTAEGTGGAEPDESCH